MERKKDTVREQTAEKKYRASENYVYRRIAGSGVLVPVGNQIADFNGYVELNESAGFLWQKLQNPATVEELVQALVKEYGIPQQQAAEDFDEFLQMMQAHKMVEVQ